jgi:zinc/manganese transport system permease protein
MSSFISGIIEPGFFSSPEVQTALIVGGVVAAVSGVVGLFTVLRGQSFAGHALADVGTAGGSASYLVAAPALWGFLVFSLAGAAVMETIGVQRARGRDLATGIVLGAALGAAALFLYLDTTMHSNTGATMTVLFGSIFAINPSTIPLVVSLSAICLAMILVLYRPLLTVAIHPDIAAARRIPVRLVGACYLAAMAITAALTSITVGAILSTALLIGPAATAIKVTRRPANAMLVAAFIGVGATWLGIVLAYDSHSWPPRHQGWPVSFFVVVLVCGAYLITDLTTGARRARHRRGRSDTDTSRIEVMS